MHLYQVKEKSGAKHHVSSAIVTLKKIEKYVL